MSKSFTECQKCGMDKEGIETQIRPLIFRPQEKNYPLDYVYMKMCENCWTETEKINIAIQKKSNDKKSEGWKYYKEFVKNKCR